MELNRDNRHPDWDLLVSWIAIVQTGGVSAAGNLLGISQAAVSQRIKQLELACGTQLLDRSTRPAQPTAAGHRLFEHAKDLLGRADQMMESVRSVSRAKRMIVRFGCVDSFAATVGPLLIKALGSSSHQIRLWSGITPVLNAQMDNRQLDLVVTTVPAAGAGLARYALFSEDYYVILPKGFEVPAYGTLRDLSDKLQFIRYSERSVIGAEIDVYLARCGDIIERACEFDTTDPLLSLVANGVGFAITTPLCLWQSRHFITDVEMVPLSRFHRNNREYPVLKRTFYLSYRSNELGALPRDVRDLIKLGALKHLSGDISKALRLSAPALNILDESSDAALAS